MLWPLNSLLEFIKRSWFKRALNKGGVGNTTRYIPLHIIALHHLTDCDSTSKFGTIAAGLKSNPAFYLFDFGNDPTHINFPLVEQFLVNEFKPGTSCTSMDLQLHCLDNPNIIPLDFDFKQNNGTFQPGRLEALLPENFLCYKALSTYKFKHQLLPLL